jgi:hypothetical protein
MGGANERRRTEHGRRAETGGNVGAGGLPLIKGTERLASRYWDCCKPCALTAGNVSGKAMQSCDVNSNQPSATTMR